MHPYLSHLMAEDHIAELRREADEYRRTHPRSSPSSRNRTPRRVWPFGWFGVRALVGRLAAF